MKIVTVIGARPQFIKAAAVSRILRSRSSLTEILVHTGQHYDENLSAIFFRELEIAEPALNLEVGSAPHGEQTARMMRGIEPILLAERPDWVLVYGDTNSTLAGALVAVKLCIRVAHVEAGVRSFNRAMPEEINRIVADVASDLLLTPTTTATQQLKREGISDKRIRQVGDVMFDAALFFAKKADVFALATLQRLGVTPKSYVLTTVHRAENTNASGALPAIVGGLSSVAETMPVIFPVHPRTREAMKSMSAASRIQFIDPVGYLEMAALEKNAAVIATDSGGVQKEAFFYRVPCVILREQTEWTELVEMRWSRLCPPRDALAVCNAILEARNTAGRDAAPFGDGQAAERIVDELLAIE